MISEIIMQSDELHIFICFLLDLGIRGLDIMESLVLSE